MKNKIIKSKVIKDKIEKSCSICGKKIKIIFYADNLYEGGYFFGKIPISTKKEWAGAIKSGTASCKFGNKIIQVLKKNPKPHKYVEYWECLKCYKGV